MESNEVEVEPTSGSGGGKRKELKWGFSLDLEYAKSIHGICLAGITVVSLIAFICVSAGRAANKECAFVYGSGYSFYGFVSFSAFLTGLINYVMYIFTFYDKLFFKFVPWNVFWLIWTGIWGFLYLIAAIVVAAQACSQAGNQAAAFFGFVCLAFLAVLGFFSFQTFRAERSSGRGPQSSTTAPEYNAERNLEQY